MKRKIFLKAVSLTTASIIVPSQKIFSSENNYENDQKNSLKIMKPPKLNYGDKIALVAPGSYISKEELEESVKKIESFGFKLVYSEKILEQEGYFAGNDFLRAADLQEKFDDKSVNAIMCVRGGYGCARILPLLNYQSIKKNPKILIGYSDCTALLYGIFKKTGLITFHGPVSISTFNEFSIKNMNDVLMNRNNYPFKFLNATDQLDENPYGIVTLVKGKAKGRLVGGNLSIMTSLIGTEFDISYDNSIVFIEEVGEEPYRIDRMITQLIQAKKFDKAEGIMLGIFKDCEPKKEKPKFEKSFTLMDVLIDRISKINLPAVYGMSFGHIVNKFTIPFGATALLDAEEQSFSILESPVI